MIGIDIVDLQDPLLKLRTENDLRFLDGPDDSHEFEQFNYRIYWMIWAAKEAVFKSYRLLNSFDPKSIPLSCDFKNGTFSSQQITGRWIVDDTYILAIVPGNEEVHFKIGQSTHIDTSNEIREQIVRDFHLIGRQVKVKNDTERLPELLTNDNQRISQLSLSHHGTLTAYAWIKP